MVGRERMSLSTAAKKIFENKAGPLDESLLFCKLCGSLMTVESAKFACCSLCGFRRPANDLLNKEITYMITAEDICRELHIEPLVQTQKTVIADEGVQRAVVNEECPKCRNPQLEYYTKQLRSADEGQTVFYECPKCKHHFSVNT